MRVPVLTHKLQKQSMHWSVLVPLTDIEPSRFEGFAEQARAEAAAIQPAEGLSGIAAKLQKEYLEGMNSDFSVAVDDAVNRAMEPYGGESEEYSEFYDETEDLKAQYETDTVSVFTINGKHYRRYDEKCKGLELCPDGVVRERVNPNDWQDKRVYLSPRAQKTIAEEIPAKVFYKTFKKYADDRSTYYEDEKAWGYYSNPNTIYDWYSLGGRWQGEFLVKEGAEYYGGVSGVGGPYDRPAPEGYVWCSACRIKDLEVDKMLEEKRRQYLERQAKLRTAWEAYLEGGQEKFKEVREKEGLPSYFSATDDGIESIGCLAFDPNVDAEANAAAFKRETVLADIFHAILDTQQDYHDFPYQECDGHSPEEWAEIIEDILADYNENDVIATVDCHN